MPPEKESCSECGATLKTCPECGGANVSVDLVGNGGVDSHASGTTPSPDHGEFARQAQSGDGYVFKHVCWDCGWDETREVTVEVIAG